MQGKSRQRIYAVRTHLPPMPGHVLQRILAKRYQWNTRTGRVKGSWNIRRCTMWGRRLIPCLWKARSKAPSADGTWIHSQRSHVVTEGGKVKNTTFKQYHIACELPVRCISRWDWWRTQNPPDPYRARASGSVHWYPQPGNCKYRSQYNRM